MHEEQMQLREHHCYFVSELKHSITETPAVCLKLMVSASNAEGNK